MVRETSETRAHALWPRETRGGEQAHHPEGDASAGSSRRIDLNEWTADEAFAHDLISHRVVRRAGGAMDKKVKTERTTSGLPVLSDGAGWIECHVVNQIPEGDHPIVLAEVADVGPGKGKPIFLESLGWHYGG